MVITKLEITKRGRISIFADDQFCFSTDTDTLAQFGLHKGMVLTVEELEAVNQSTQLRTAKEKAFSLLSYSGHSKKQLYDKLRRKNNEEQASQGAVQRMEELGLIDDNDYAHRAMQDMLHLKGWGLTRIKAELRKRGIAPEIIENCLEELEDYDGPQRAVALITRKYKAHLSSPKGKDKIIAALMRLGYDYSDIKIALTQVLEDYTNDDDYYSEE